MPVHGIEKMRSVEEENGNDCQDAQPVDVINSFHGFEGFKCFRQSYVAVNCFSECAGKLRVRAGKNGVRIRKSAPVNFLEYCWF
jgi:hypothetical protein